MAADSLPYTKHDRLADVLALIQVLSLDRPAHRSEDGLLEELQGKPKSAESWTTVAAEHPEFFRVRAEGTHRVSLVARHVLPKGDDGVRDLAPELIGKLLQAALEIHDRQLPRAHHWKAYVPIVVAVTAGVHPGLLARSAVESEEVEPQPFLRPLAQTARAVFPQAAFRGASVCGVIVSQVRR